MNNLTILQVQQFAVLYNLSLCLISTSALSKINYNNKLMEDSCLSPPSSVQRKNVNNDQEKSETSNNQVEDDDYGITYEDVKILEAMEEAEKLKQEEKRKLEDGEKLKQEETEIKEKT